MEALHTGNKDILYEKFDGILDWTVTDTRAQHYVEIVSLSIRSNSLGATHCVAIYRLTTYNSTSES